MSKQDQVRAEYEKKLAEAAKEDTITSLVPAGARIFIHSLYGTVGSVTYGDSHGGQEKACTWEKACELIRALPPVSLTMVRDGCLSFKPTSYVDALPEEKKDRWKEESAVSPVLVHIEGFQGPTFELGWITDLAGIGLVHVKCSMGFAWASRGIGTYDAKRVEFRGGYRYEPARFTPAPDLHTIHDPYNSEPTAQLESPIRWASGGPEYPSRITLYFVDLGADMNPAHVGRAIVDGLAKLAREGK